MLSEERAKHLVPATQGPARRETGCFGLRPQHDLLWTFVAQEGIEPTDANPAGGTGNAAERPLRRGVIWRRRSFGSQSEAGSLFVERILTAVLTLRQQKRDVLDFLTEAC